MTLKQLLQLPDAELAVGLAKMEREVIGHALALTHWLDYIGIRPQGKFWDKLFNATDKLRAAARAAGRTEE